MSASLSGMRRPDRGPHPAGLPRAGLVAAAISIICAAGVAASPASLQSALDADGQRNPAVKVSVLFAPVEGSGPDVSLDADQALPPASVEKIVTSAAALDVLGPGYHFTTRAWTDGVIRDGRVEGSLYLEGNGDPFLVTERLWLLAHAVAARGVRGVTGDLVVDATVIADLDSIRAAERSDSPYTAPVSMLAVNFNDLTFVVRPAERPGEAAAAAFDPFPIPGLSIVNHATTGAPASSPSLTMTRAGAVWTIGGTIPAGSPPVWIYKAADDPALLAGGVFAGLLAQNGITITGDVRSGRTPAAAALIDSLPSLPLGTLIRSMNGFSNNFMADVVLTALGDRTGARSGLDRLRAWLRERPALDPLPAIHDGSGLSPRNRISARAIVRLLTWAQGQERIFPDLYASLPRPGEDGTLERRFLKGDAPAIRAKTGTLGDIGVSGIAGYIDHPTAGRYAFCILQKSSGDARMNIPDLRAREDRWLREFVAP